MSRQIPPAISANYDAIIIGAGINGCGIARDAATRGLRVLLLDKGDIGGGTTAWSTRLIHGGLRYLEHGELGLVRESLRERETLLGIAPHLV
ncbi:MAG: FAD-dependent oxidoreductase, partial [Acidobacteria bacterium]